MIPRAPVEVGHVYASTAYPGKSPSQPVLWERRKLNAENFLSVASQNIDEAIQNLTDRDHPAEVMPVTKKRPHLPHVARHSQRV